MDRALTDQKDIPWFEMVGFSLNVIGDFSGKKDDDLVKIMVMIRKFPVCAVINVEQTEFFFEITCFLKCVLRIIHGNLLGKE